jgi:hypothetical protein
MIDPLTLTVQAPVLARNAPSPPLAENRKAPGSTMSVSAKGYLN